MPLLISKNSLYKKQQSNSITSTSITVPTPTDDVSYDEYSQQVEEAKKSYLDKELNRINRQKSALGSATSNRTKLKSVGLIKKSGGTLSSNEEYLLNKDIDKFNKTSEQFITAVTDALKQVDEAEYNRAMSEKPNYISGESYESYVDRLNKWQEKYTKTLGRGEERYEKSKKMFEDIDTELKKVDETEYEKAMSEKPRYDLGQDYSSYLDEINKWQEKYGSILGRGEERYASTTKELENYQSELDRLNLYSEVGLQAKGTDLLKLSPLGFDLAQVKLNATEAVETLIPASSRRQIWNYKSKQWEDFDPSISYGSRQYKGIYHNGDYKPLKYQDIPIAAYTKTDYLDPTKEYAITYYDTDKTKIKNIKQLHGKYDSNNDNVLDSEYTPYEINFDESGNIMSEKISDIFNLKTTKTKGDPLYKEFSPYAKAEYKDNKIIASGIFQSNYTGGQGFYWYNNKPYESVIADLQVGLKPSKLQKFGSYDSFYDAHYNTDKETERPVGEVVWKESGIGKYEEVDYLNNTITLWGLYNEPLRSNYRQIVGDLLSKKAAKKLKNTNVLYNPYTGNIQGYSGGSYFEFITPKAVEKVDIKQSKYGNVRQTSDGSWVRNDADDTGKQIRSTIGLTTQDNYGLFLTKQQGIYTPGYGERYTKEALRGETMLGILSPAEKARDKIFNQNYMLDNNFARTTGSGKDYINNIDKYSKQKQDTWLNANDMIGNYKKQEKLQGVMQYSQVLASDLKQSGFKKKDTIPAVSNMINDLFYSGGGASSRKQKKYNISNFFLDGKKSKVLNAKSFLGSMRSLW